MKPFENFDWKSFWDNSDIPRINRQPTSLNLIGQNLKSNISKNGGLAFATPTFILYVIELLNLVHFYI